MPLRMNPLFGKPFVLSIGPQRCGSVWLDDYFRQRGDICSPRAVKEIFFFDRHFQRGADFYLSHFHTEDKHRMVMEITTTAFDAPEAPERVFNLLTRDVTLLCPLRDPVARAYAAYEDFLRYGIVSGSIAEAVEQAPQILHSSRYAEHLVRWIERFGRAAVKTVYYEQRIKNPDLYARQLCTALELPYIRPAPHTGGQPPARRMRFFRKARATPATADKATISWLRERLEDETRSLERLLGEKISFWSI